MGLCMKRFLGFLSICLFSTCLLANDDFPGRDRYPAVKFISIDDLYKQLDDFVILDARSSYEFNTLRIKNAQLLPLTLVPSKFESALRRVVSENPGKKLVFYCNGHTCMKSYKAAHRATNYVGLDNVYAYDAGIFDWAKKYPAKSELLGKELKDLSLLKTKAELKKHIIPAEKFIKTADDSVIILDIRDRIERDGFYVFSGFEKSISLNPQDRDKMAKFMKKVIKSKKKLYVYDKVGKQIRWFQYYIESTGVKDYYFMEGGSEAFFKIPLKNLLDS